MENSISKGKVITYEYIPGLPDFYFIKVPNGSWWDDNIGRPSIGKLLKDFGDYFFSGYGNIGWSLKSARSAQIIIYKRLSDGSIHVSIVSESELVNSGFSFTPDFVEITARDWHVKYMAHKHVPDKNEDKNEEKRKELMERYVGQIATKLVNRRDSDEAADACIELGIDDTREYFKNYDVYHPKYVARLSVRYAKALIEELEKTEYGKS